MNRINSDNFDWEAWRKRCDKVTKKLVEETHNYFQDITGDITEDATFSGYSNYWSASKNGN
jgi:hypothetical protein